MEKQKNKQRMWKDNGRWKNGKSSDYRRRITGAKKWEIVHHKDANKAHNTKDNLTKLKPNKKMNATWVHNKLHPSKAIAWGKAKAKSNK